MSQVQTQQQQVWHRYGNLTPSMQNLPNMQHQKEVSVMQKHAPSVSDEYNDHMVPKALGDERGHYRLNSIRAKLRLIQATDWFDGEI